MAGAELQLFAEDMDFSNEANERLTCNYEGNDMEIAFNAKPLVEMLSILETESIQLSMSEPSRPGLITPYENQNPNEHILMLVMPVMINR